MDSEANVMFGCSSAPKKSADSRWAFSSSLLTAIALTGADPVIVRGASSAASRLPVTSLNSPRNTLTPAWRIVKPMTLWPAAIGHVPGSTREPAVVVMVCPAPWFARIGLFANRRTATSLSEVPTKKLALYALGAGGLRGADRRSAADHLRRRTARDHRQAQGAPEPRPRARRPIPLGPLLGKGHEAPGPGGASRPTTPQKRPTSRARG